MSVNLYNRSGSLVGQSTPIDATPVSGSDNAVKSGGVYDSIENAPDKSIVFEPKNLIDKNKCVDGTFNNSTGEITTSDTYAVSDFIEVDTDNVYISADCDKFAAYKSDKTFISIVSINETIYGDQSLAFPANTKYIRLRFAQSDEDTAVCADVRYYTNGTVSGVEYTGIENNVMQAVKNGLSQYAIANPDMMVESGNLFDYRKDFVQIASNYGLIVADGSFDYKSDTIAKDADFVSTTRISLDKYYPIEYGEMVVCNYFSLAICFYNSSKTFISTVQNKYGYQATEAPSNSAYFRIMLKGSSSSSDADIITSLSQLKNIILFKVAKVGENDLIPKHNYLGEKYKIEGGMISPNYLDKVHPSMQDSDFLSAMKCMAIREVNARDHAYRFGTFNMWIMENTKGWNNVQRMLMDCGIDFCGFQECVINESTTNYKGIAEFLHSWQFPYGFYTNWTDGEDTIDKSFVSRFEILSSTKHTFASASSNATYLNCKVQMPRYLDVYDPKKVLSVYIVHFAITLPENKIEIANELLGVIANDTSDFVIIMGDTNDFGLTDEAKDYWVTLESGGFTPVIPIKTKTITQDELEQESDWQRYCIDQFLISSNIRAVGYNVINTKDKYYITDGYENSSTDNEHALSDHDFVYCDLQFDYDTPRTIIPVDNE